MHLENPHCGVSCLELFFTSFPGELVRRHCCGRIACLAAWRFFSMPQRPRSLPRTFRKMHRNPRRAVSRPTRLNATSAYKEDEVPKNCFCPIFHDDGKMICPYVFTPGLLHPSNDNQQDFSSSPEEYDNFMFRLSNSCIQHL